MVDISQPLNMEGPNLTIFSAKRNSGKTHLLTYMIYRCARSFNDVIIMTPTAFNGHYKKFTDNVVPRFDEDLLVHIMERQAELTKQKKVNKILLVLDDCVSAANFASQVFEQIATQGRHYQVSCWITTQHFTKLPPCIRLNCDYMIILGNQTRPVVKMIFEELGGIFDDEKHFTKTMKPELLNYGAFVLNNMRGSAHVLKAPTDLPRFRIRRRT
jgi:hypothetical protein